ARTQHRLLERRCTTRGSRHGALVDHCPRPSAPAILRDTQGRVAASGAEPRPDLASALGRGGAARASSAAPAHLGTHPSLRGQLVRSERSVLGRVADGLLLPVRLWLLAPEAQGDGEPLAAARTDLGGRASVACARLRTVAEHRSLVRRILRKALHMKTSRPAS